MSDYTPVVTMIIIAILFAGTFLLLSWRFGPKRPIRNKLSVYECGLDPVTEANERFSVKFYLVAMVFILFDIEVVFLYPWAIAFSQSLPTQTHLPLLYSMGSFMFFLALGLVYVWRLGALDWQKR